MARFTVYFQTTASSSIEVEADSKEEAVGKAYETFDAPSICARCSGWGADHCLDLGDDWVIKDEDADVEEVQD